VCQLHQRDGRADGDIRYGLKNDGTINNVSPGVFFFYGTFTVAGSQDKLVVDLREFFNADENDLSFDSSDPAFVSDNDFIVQQQQAFLYRVSGSAPGATCSVQSANVTKVFSNGDADVVITFDPSGNVPVPTGTYVLGVKYTPSPLLTDGDDLPCNGEVVPPGTTPLCRYWFVPSLDNALQEFRAVNFLFQER